MYGYTAVVRVALFALLGTLAVPALAQVPGPGALVLPMAATWIQ
jgi:hypothetical protein